MWRATGIKGQIRGLSLLSKQHATYLVVFSIHLLINLMVKGNTYRGYENMNLTQGKVVNVIVTNDFWKLLWCFLWILQWILKWFQKMIFHSFKNILGIAITPWNWRVLAGATGFLFFIWFFTVIHKIKGIWTLITSIKNPLLIMSFISER